jgi:hypothetical protein
MMTTTMTTTAPVDMYYLPDWGEPPPGFPEESTLNGTMASITGKVDGHRAEQFGDRSRERKPDLQRLPAGPSRADSFSSFQISGNHSWRRRTSGYAEAATCAFAGEECRPNRVGTVANGELIKN